MTFDGRSSTVSGLVVLHISSDHSMCFPKEPLEAIFQPNPFPFVRNRSGSKVISPARHWKQIHKNLEAIQQWL